MLFIDASEMGYMKDRAHRDLDDTDLEKITNTYHNWRKNENYNNIKGFCKSASFEDIKKHGYVLTPARYVDLLDVEDDGIPFETKMKDLTNILTAQIKEEVDLNAEITKQLSNIGIKL